jgi:hypothetical protein
MRGRSRQRAALIRLRRPPSQGHRDPRSDHERQLSDHLAAGRPATCCRRQQRVVGRASARQPMAPPRSDRGTGSYGCRPEGRPTPVPGRRRSGGAAARRTPPLGGRRGAAGTAGVMIHPGGLARAGSVHHGRPSGCCRRQERIVGRASAPQRMAPPRSDRGTGSSGCRPEGRPTPVPGRRRSGDAAARRSPPSPFVHRGFALP